MLMENKLMAFNEKLEHFKTCQLRPTGVVIVIFEHISNLVLVFLLLT